MNANLYRYDKCPHCGAATNGNVIGLSDGSSVFAWRCMTCEHEWPRHSFVRIAYALNDKMKKPKDK